jgi:glycosyltransferase involved in cell wall biosynthesis
MGKPVIGSRIGGIPELIEHGVEGYLFEPQNALELRYWINFCLAHQSLLPKMGRSARTKAERLFDPEIHYHHLMRIYSRFASCKN